MSSRFAFKGLAVFLNLAILLGAEATLIKPMSLHELAATSQISVYGKVRQVLNNSKGWRIAEVEVLEHIRGPKTASRINVQLLQRGSLTEGWVERVPDAMELREGEEVVLFLNWSERTKVWVPVALKLSKYRVEEDTRGARRALSWKDGPINYITDEELLTPSSVSKRQLTNEKNKMTKTTLEGAMLLERLISEVRGVSP